jgi:pyruvate formate lyase activating enzyme
LLIPTLNDQPAEQEALVTWLSNLDPNLVLHYSRYFPRYKLDLPLTGEEVLKRTLELAKKKLNYVYLGNVEIPGTGDTLCPECGNLLITRSGYQVKIVGLRGSSCNRCGNSIKIIIAE